MENPEDNSTSWSWASLCFRCGKPGHWSSSCPTRRSESTPPPAPADARPANKDIPPLRRDPAEISGTPSEWASYARRRLGITSGDPMVDSPFRHQQGIAPRAASDLAALAAAQVEEARRTRGSDLDSWFRAAARPTRYASLPQH